MAGLTKVQKERIDAYKLIPKIDALQGVFDHLVRVSKIDIQYAPGMLEKLRHVYPKIMETVYPEYLASNGGILPIDSSPHPADQEWKYFRMDWQGYADWIDSDGSVMPSSSATMTEYTGKFGSIGSSWVVTLDDLENAAKLGVPLSATKGKVAKKAHDAKTNWVWLFGDAAKGIDGLVNHPHISHQIAAENAGATSREWADKTNEEILADLDAVVDGVANGTEGAYHIAKIYLPRELMQLLRNRYIASTATGMVTLWNVIKEKYLGDDTGQGKVEFSILNEASSRRSNPHPYAGDDSGYAGRDFILALPAANIDDMAFIKSRPFQQLPPQEEDFKIKTLTRSRIGGARVQIPQAVVVLTFAPAA